MGNSNKRQMSIRRLMGATMLALAALAGETAWAQNDGVITVKTGRAGRALVERWIEAYREVHPETRIELVDGKAAGADLVLGQRTQETERMTYVGRYALLPVTSAANPLREELERRAWSAKDLGRLFFAEEDEEEEDGAPGVAKGRKERLAGRLTVYSGTRGGGWTATVARHFGREAEELRGRKIGGDDVFLLQALADDPTGVAYSSLSCLYDPVSRHLRGEVVVLPLQARTDESDGGLAPSSPKGKGLREALLSGSLDEAIEVLEGGRFDAVPVERLGFSYRTFDRDIDQFLEWVLNDGQRYLPEQGFLRLEGKDVEQQISLLAVEGGRK